MVGFYKKKRKWGGGGGGGGTIGDSFWPYVYMCTE